MSQTPVLSIQKGTVNPYQIFALLLSMPKEVHFPFNAERMIGPTLLLSHSYPITGTLALLLRYFNRACKHVLFFDALSFSIINPQHEINRLKTFNHVKMQLTKPQMTSAHHHTEQLSSWKLCLLFALRINKLS